MRAVLTALLAAAAWSFAASAQPAGAPLQLQILGGLGGVSQYNEHELPFWTQRIPARSGGRIQAEITPFDRSGVRAEEVVHLARLGIAPFASLLLGALSAEEPRVAAPELAGLNPDLATQRATVDAYRPVLYAVLRETFGVEPLAIYTYPAQVIFCARPITGLADLAGRKVRVSSVVQSDFFAGLGATPVTVPFNQLVGALRSGVAECAVTGTLSGNQLGLHEVTTHLYPMAITWGLSVFVANAARWAALPDEARTFLRAELAQLESEIWEAAARDTAEGVACNAGRPDCTRGVRGRMTVPAPSPADEALRRDLLLRAALPRWLDRCGRPCAGEWNRTLGQRMNLVVDAD